ncbi:MAG: hypothetical protein HYS32_00335 [Candidatus Woesearchaeota archaeon]|nr:MAG: hypothetical protein HYS32_00335 [Candidatus Woesearchaeota archaeon]
MLIHLFKKEPIPKKVPYNLQIEINKLKKSKDKLGCLKKAHKTITSKFHGGKFLPYVNLFQLFEENPKRLWNKASYLDCVHLNYLLRILLIKSGFFTEEDIKLKITAGYLFFPHQYLKIKINKKFIDVDCWGYKYGKDIGKHCNTFNC